MDAIECVKELASRSGKSYRSISIELGRYPTYIGTSIGKGNRMQAGNLSAIADVCGYTLALVPKSAEMPADAIIVD